MCFSSFSPLVVKCVKHTHTLIKIEVILLCIINRIHNSEDMAVHVWEFICTLKRILVSEDSITVGWGELLHISWKPDGAIEKTGLLKGLKKFQKHLLAVCVFFLIHEENPTRKLIKSTTVTTLTSSMNHVSFCVFAIPFILWNGILGGKQTEEIQRHACLFIHSHSEGTSISQCIHLFTIIEK